MAELRYDVQGSLSSPLPLSLSLSLSPGLVFLSSLFFLRECLAQFLCLESFRKGLSNVQKFLYSLEEQVLLTAICEGFALLKPGRFID